MRSELLIVATAGRLPRLEARGALAARRTLADTVHLVSAAATPLGGDSIRVRVVVEPGARLRLRSAAATVVLPGRTTTESESLMELHIAGDLDIDLEPTVVAGGARHHTAVVATLEEAGTLRWRERVQIGRSGERHGFWSGTVRADLKGSPLLRHRVELGAGSVADDDIAAPRASISEIRYPADQPGGPSALPAGTCVLPLAAGGELSTWQGERLPAG
ncbi:urease accessory protein UreD [Mycolicibacterium palauense]|uniref:urease accessory protein UreD n=1 Tax=Mycolicibacterium palauense TaxID=2034511 RepID=UPI000BFEF85D|nr:urease accessory protein UreD [Mycolicibacterium palauense]